MWKSEPQFQLFIRKKFKKSYSIETLNLKVKYINRGNFIRNLLDLQLEANGFWADIVANPDWNLQTSSKRGPS